MALIKLSNNGVKNITSVGSIGTGDLVFISKQTASSSATIDFTSNIDSTYKEYIFYFVNIHGASNDGYFLFQADTGTNTNYNQTITSTNFRAQHNEGGTESNLSYRTGDDLAQSTSFQRLSSPIGTENDECMSGMLHVFNPSSSTFVKHFIARTSTLDMSDHNQHVFVAGYFNTTTALTRFRFKSSTGNIESGDILLYGVN
jgi:hypothetical protein